MGFTVLFSSTLIFVALSTCLLCLLAFLDLQKDIAGSKRMLPQNGISGAQSEPNLSSSTFIYMK